PPINGSVSGQVLGGDSVTPIPGATVSFQSNNTFYGRTYTLFADATGNFTLLSILSNNGNTVPVPLDSFTLRATDNQTGLVSPATLGSFPPGLILAIQNVVFTNSGLVTGTVRRANGDVVSFGTVQISGGDLPHPATTSIATDGNYGFAGVPSG